VIAARSQAEAERLRRQLLDPGAAIDEDAVEAALAAPAGAAPEASASVPRALVVDTTDKSGLLGPASTGLEVVVDLRMTHVPTSICHLFDPETHPLVTCRMAKALGVAGGIRRLRVTCAVEGYSAPAIATTELEKTAPVELDLLPTFFPERLREVTELTRATVTVLVEDLDNGKVEVHRTGAVWLLARNAAPLTVLDPKTGRYQDLTQYFGAFVTPNDPMVMAFLAKVRDHHPGKQLAGYQGDRAGVVAQVKAVYEAVAAEVDVSYVNSTIAFSPTDTVAVQRVRLPRDVLADGAANCIDGTVLLASLLEAMSLNPGIVTVPGHAFLAFEEWADSGDWKFVETTMLGTHPFEAASARADAQAASLRAQSEKASDPSLFRLRPLRELRNTFGIVPMVV
jgi:hypothetical protein